MYYYFTLHGLVLRKKNCQFSIYIYLCHQSNEYHNSLKLSFVF